ncbi:IS3 family transposase [Enorma phocaeensis]|uniref:IS3 family transposase n=1 Tax=Enorma phocaeensis TaxID=1871019 RepID=UPI00235321E8|nr:IS3 family transposase [Enorma phocaeensis]
MPTRRPPASPASTRGPAGPGQEGRHRAGAGRGQPLPDGGGPARAEARERAAEEGERDAFESERLPRRQAAVGSQAEGARFASILLNEGAWSISEMCAALHVTRQGYHAWKKRPPSAHYLRDAELAAAISEICTASRRIYGAPKVFAELRRSGERTSRKRVARIMRENGRAGTTRGCAKRPEGGARQAAPQANSAPDLVRRDLSADGPNRARFADITYVRTHKGWPCLAVVMDIWSRKIVGWSMSARMTAELADDALRMAIARRRPPRGCIHHSDHGSQHASLLLGKTMRAAGIRPSMGSISSPRDNAATESLTGPIKAECVHARTFESRERAALEIFEYIECSCNSVRIHSALGNLSPEEVERANRPGEGRRPMAA